MRLGGRGRILRFVRGVIWAWGWGWGVGGRTVVARCVDGCLAHEEDALAQQSCPVRGEDQGSEGV